MADTNAPINTVSPNQAQNTDTNQAHAPQTQASSAALNNMSDLRSDLDNGSVAANSAKTAQPVANQSVAANASSDLASDLNNITPAAGQPLNRTAPAQGNVNTPSTNLAASGLAAHTLTKPTAGHTETVHVASGEVIATKFDPNTADLALHGKDLVLSFNDGSKIVLQDFAADTHNLPTIALPDGALVAGGIIVAQLQGTNDELFNLETAAGASRGGGNFIYSDDLGRIIGLLDKLPPIPFTALQFSQPDPQVFQQLFIPNQPGGSFTTTTTTDLPPIIDPPGPGTPVNPGFPGGATITVAGGFEDWQPDQHIGDSHITPMQLNINFTPLDNEVVDQVTLSGFPNGVQLFFRDADGNISPLTLTNGSVTLSGADMANGNVLILPFGNSGTDIPFNITMTIRDPDTGQTAVLSQNAVAVVDSVADLPIMNSSISLNGETATGVIVHDLPNPGASTVHGHEEQPVSLNLNVVFPDNDGSEVHTITLGSVPGSWVLQSSPGVTFTVVHNADGTNTYTATVTGNVNTTLTFQTNNWSGDATLFLNAKATETVTDGELTTANNTAQVNTVFGVHVDEDKPTLVAISDPVSIQEATLLVPGIDRVSGNITVDFHTDGPGNVTLTTEGLSNLGLTSHGQPLSYVLSPDGHTITASNPAGLIIFTVTLNPPTVNGTEQTTGYTFSLYGPLDHAAGGGNNNINIPVHFNATDSDGDSISGSFPVIVVDDVPTGGTGGAVTDETNNFGTALNGVLQVNFGADGSGTTTENNQFNASGSMTGGTLTSHGVSVVVTLENGMYVGKANGVTVFTMDIKADGTYTFTQYAALDHADGNNANDIINLKFGFTATDYDGDSASGTVTIQVRDDAPLAVADVATLNDTNTATGNVITNDTLSHDTPNLLSTIHQVLSDTIKAFSTPDGIDAGGKFLLVDGAYGQLKIYENGTYTYTLNAGNNGNHTEVFEYSLVDGDGDHSTTTLTINIVDGVPGPAPDVVRVVDETTDLGHTIDGTITVPGATTYGFGLGLQSVPTATGSVAGVQLTSGGSPVTISLVNGQYVGMAMNGTTVFTLTLNANGTYTFTQFAPLDHAATSDPNDVITLHFGYGAADADGDAVNGTITVDVRDDAPLAVADVNSIPDGGSTATGNVVSNDVLSHDTGNTLKDASFNGVTKSFNVAGDFAVDGGGKYVLINGAYGVLKIYENGSYTYTYNSAAFSGNHQETFNYTLKDYDGDTSSTTLKIDISDNGPGTPPSVVQTVDETTDLGVAIGGTVSVPDAVTYTLGGPTGATGSLAGGALTSRGEPVTITLVNGHYVGTTSSGDEVFTLTMNPNGTYTFVLTGVLDHADGANPNDVIDLTFTYNAADADGDSVSGTITVHVLDDAPLAVADTATLNNTTTATGNVIIPNDVWSHDIVNVLKDASFGGTTKSLSTPDGVDANGAFVILNGTYGTLKIYLNGEYVYTLNANNVGNHTEVFNYTLVDHDGDTSSTTLTIDIVDNGPGVPPLVNNVIDETGGFANNIATGTIVVQDATTYTLGGPTSADGSMAGGALTSNGVPVTISLVNGQYVGTANGTTIFTLTLNANGAYTFTLLGQLDHANASDPNDVINLHFTYNASDADGDSVSGTINIDVKDDAPTAIADTATLNNTLTATGNVVTNDIMSQDIANTLKDASFGGTTKSFATPDGIDAGGKFVLVTGQYGVLKLYENGTYTYTLNANNVGNHTEVFNYTLVDHDGDTSSTTLTLNIIDGVPGPAPAVVNTLDETTDLNTALSQTITVTGATQFTMGSPSGAPTFAAGGSLAGGALTSHGVGVTVTLVNGVYVGMAGAVQVFTLSINNNGTYTFTQFAVLDHADGSNANDIINLNFAYTASDADGDAVSSTITINVRDDAPVAVADVNSVAAGGTNVAGNVMTNDALSHDVTNNLSGASFGGTVKSFGTPDGLDAGGKFVMLTGTYGVLKLYENGNYTYTLNNASSNPGNGGNHTDQFNYTIKDYDGDTSSTTLTLNSIQPKLIVGENVNDGLFSNTPYHVGSGQGSISGTGSNDILIGDVGGVATSAVPKNYNIVMILDTSASMNANNKLAMLKAAVLNLMSDFHDYTGGTVRVEFVTFNINAQAHTTSFVVTNQAEYLAAINFINGIVTGQDYTNYEAALQAAQNWLNGSMGGNVPTAGAENYTYFVSDGQPNRYLNGSVVTIGTAATSMSQIHGSDGTDEVQWLQDHSHVFSIGIGVDTSTIGNMDTIASDGHAINVQNPNDLSGALQGNNPINYLAQVGSDTISGGAGDDIIFGDTLNTDHLAQVYNLNMPAGKGWAVFEHLEANNGWTRTDTVNYIRNHIEELARETHNPNGEGRLGGNDNITGGDGNDILIGQEGNDTINGGNGNDLIIGGSGNNTITGGAGADTFMYLKGSTGHDTLTDYSNAQGDKLDISDLLVGSGYTPGGNVNNYVKIDHLTGDVFVDSTGAGNFGSANHIATINNISSMQTVNVILNDNEGTKVVHTV